MNIVHSFLLENRDKKFDSNLLSKDWFIKSKKISIPKLEQSETMISHTLDKFIDYFYHMKNIDLCDLLVFYLNNFLDYMVV